MQKNYSRNFDPAHPGFLSGQGTPQVASMVNTANDQPQSFDLEPAAAGAGAASYEVVAEIPGKQTAQTSAYISFTAAHTVADITEELSNALNFTDSIYDVATSDADATKVTVTGRNPNEDVISTLTYTTTGGGAMAITETGAAKSGTIQFGVFVAQDAGDAFNQVRPMESGLKVCGGALSTYFVEKDSVGPNAKTEYPSGDAVDVVRKTLSNDGLWMRALQGDISPADTLYASYDAASRGWVSNTNTNADAVPNAAAKKTAQLKDGSTIVLVELS